MSIFLLIVSIIVAGIAFNFFYWKALKEDYVNVKIFSSALATLLLTIILACLPLLIIPSLSDSSIFSKSGLWFWGGVIGFSLGVLISKWKFGFRLNESFEASINGLWVFLLIICLPWFPLGAAIFALLLLIYYFLKLNYKKFTIYKSGKIGIASLITVGIFFIIRAVVAIFLNPHMLSLIGKFDGILSSIAIFLSFLAVYNLAYNNSNR